MAQKILIHISLPYDIRQKKGRKSMTRLVMFGLLIAIVVLMVLGIFFLKDSYQLLPLSASKIGAPGPFTSWRPYDSPSGKFSVMFPAAAQNATQNITDPKTQTIRHYDMYVAQKGNGSMFMISLITFSSNISSDDMLKKTVISDLLAANPQNQLKEMKVGSFENFQTMDFMIANSDTTVQGMTFVDGNTLYLISAVFPNRFYSADEYNYFIKSFELQKSGQDSKSKTSKT
jgi:hypothetical protein